MMISSCKNPLENPTEVLVPLPNEINFQPGHFKFEKGIKIISENENDILNKTIDLFISDIKKLTSFEIIHDDKQSRAKKISISVDKNLNMTEESYILTVTPRKIRINASGNSGVHYALQSLKQMLIIHNSGQKKIQLPCVLINDSPRFGWRGMHLDVCRHFMPVEDVKKYLDYLSLYKFNKFHWHLTEDQGWRIEIEKYPLLTEISAWRDETLIGHNRDKPRQYDGKKHGGFYTKEDIKEVIEYASERFIEVIPEIEMPGHAKAAIAAYPWLGVTGKKVEVMKEWGISPYIYMPSEETFEFLENVLTEVMELFPSEYIHIGGDEAIKDQWKNSKEVQKLIKKLGLLDEHELQSWFIQRIEKFVNSKGKKIIGWDEILEGGLAPNAAVMSWRGEEGGIHAAKQGHYVVMSPTSHCYFDYYQAEPVENEPLAIGGFLPLEKVYSYDPLPESLTEEESKYILGTQGNVWTEYMPDFKQVEHMIFPRLLAMSEVCWTLPENKDPDEFFERVKNHELIFKALGVNYSLSGMPE